MDPILDIRSLTKKFGKVTAVNDVSLTLLKGEVHALLGENGAGKSTLTKMLIGAEKPTSGEFLIDGEKMDLATPRDGLESGVAMVFQETSLVPSMSVAQNIFLGNEKPINRLRGLYIAAQNILRTMNFTVDPTMYVEDLSAAQRQMVEIARATHHGARVIIFDEPTASLTPEEKRHFFTLMRQLVADGTSIFFISHSLEEALAHADRITVLRDGEKVMTERASDTDYTALIRAMVGRDLSDSLYSGGKSVDEIRQPGEKILSIQNISMGRQVHNASFSVFNGQITGIFGLIGAGRSEVAKVVSGVVKRNHFYGGEIYYEKEAIRHLVPAPAVAAGIVYVTEDRKYDGFFETMTVAENIYLGELAASGGRSGIVPSRAEARRLSDYWAKRLNIRSVSSQAKLVELSGGNQQKVVISKALVQKPKLVIFDEPTRGVDVGAIAEIHQTINNLVDEGLAVVVISSYLPEIMTLSDRILVARQGRIVEEFSADEASEHKIMYAAVH